MDENSAKSISNITQSLHTEIDKVYEDLMDEDFENALKSIDSAIESLKHIKTNLKEYEV